MCVTRNGPRSESSLRLLIGLLMVCAVIAPTSTHAQAQRSNRADRDTMPDNVARRALEAYNRHDPTGLSAFYDTISVHEMLGDSARRFMGAPTQQVAALQDYFAKNQVHAELKQQLVSGPFVVQLYDFIENGKRTPHLDIYEIRHGKIVHEWDQGP